MGNARNVAGMSAQMVLVQKVFVVIRQYYAKRAGMRHAMNRVNGQRGMG